MQESDVSNYKEKKDNLLQRIILLFKAMPEGTETTIEALVDEIDMDVQFSFEDMFELCSDVSSFASKHHISLVEKEPFEKTGLPFRISYKVHDDKVGFPTKNLEKVLFELRSKKLNYVIIRQNKKDII